MITYEGIKSANERVERTNIRGKGYAEVPARVQAFRELCPEGQIVTEIISLSDGMVVMKATVSDEAGKVLGTGHAYEKETSSQINRTSYIENCETSAVGRALAFLGIGSEKSMASALEVQNAIQQQEEADRRAAELAAQKIDGVKVAALRSLCEKHEMNESDIAASYGVEKIEDLTEAMYRDFAGRINKKKAAS